MNARVALMAVDRRVTNIVYNALTKEFGDVEVLLEDRVNPATLINRRIKKLGPRIVAGQLLFRVIAQPLLARAAASRIQEIETEFKLNASPIPAEKIVRVPSVNSPSAVKALENFIPQIVVVLGTRILSREILASVPVPFINLHAGITPAFRGSHGGYWALVQKQRRYAGTTIHLIDRGIDTGKILKQKQIEPTRSDNFATYPHLQLAVGLPLLIESVRELLAGQVVPGEVNCPLPSRLYYHPTLWSYCKNRLFRGVK